MVYKSMRVILPILNNVLTSATLLKRLRVHYIRIFTSFMSTFRVIKRQPKRAMKVRNWANFHKPFSVWDIICALESKHNNACKTRLRIFILLCHFLKTWNNDKNISKGIYTFLMSALIRFILVKIPTGYFVILHYKLVNTVINTYLHICIQLQLGNN